MGGGGGYRSTDWGMPRYTNGGVYPHGTLTTPKGSPRGIGTRFHERGVLERGTDIAQKGVLGNLYQDGAPPEGGGGVLATGMQYEIEQQVSRPDSSTKLIRYLDPGNPGSRKGHHQKAEGG